MCIWSVENRTDNRAQPSKVECRYSTASQRHILDAQLHESNQNLWVSTHGCYEHSRGETRGITHLTLFFHGDYVAEWTRYFTKSII